MFIPVEDTEISSWTVLKGHFCRFRTALLSGISVVVMIKLE